MPGDEAKSAHTIVKGVLSMLLYVSDINECHERTSGCHQQCVNTNGSYVCACRTGYRLIADGYTCIGRLDKPFILMHNRFTNFQTLMSAVRKITDVIKLAITALVHMPVAVTVAIVSMEMD